MTASTPPKPIVLCILDGFGWRAETEDNAVAQAHAPNWKRMFAEGPRAFVATSGPAVGLPEGQMGNSEVGHMNIGSGRALLQDLDRISAAIADGSFAGNRVLANLFKAAKASGGAVHILGLLSPGGVHSHQDHIVALAKEAAKQGLAVWLHGFLDGRDVPPQSALDYLRDVEAALDGTGVRFGTIGGRYFGMDRDKRWDRVQKAYDAIVAAKAPREATPRGAVERAYAAGTTDEFVEPVAIADYPGMRDGDVVMMANFRADRVRQIMSALLDPAFDGFDRGRRIRFAAAAGMTEYSAALAKLMPAAFAPLLVPNALGEILAERGLKQLRLAETEKYAHVTYFFNGGSETIFKNEERILVASPKIATYDLQPEMSAPEVTERLVEAIHAKKHDLIVVNYANADMVGHSGKLDAAIKAIEAVDAALGKVRDALIAEGGIMFVTADHGNAETMRDPETGAPHTAHTTGDVPLLLVNAGALGVPVTLENGRLADLAPTILDILGLRRPAEMTGKPLLTRHPGTARAAE